MSKFEKFIKCDCHSEGLNIEYDQSGEYFYLSFWKMGINPSRLSWSQKLRYIWHLLFTGQAWGEEIILNKESANQVSAFIDYHLQVKSETTVE